MKTELQELIRDARKELRKASGLPLTPEEQNEELRNTAIAELNKVILYRIVIRLLFPLEGEVIWTEKGPAAILKAESCIFHLRKEGDSDSYLLFIIEGNGEREIARIEASDPYFASRVLVAIGDAVPSAE